MILSVIDAAGRVELKLDDLRAVARFAGACAGEALPLFEADRPTDARAREAIDVALAFASGGRRGKALRDAAWAALRAAKDAGPTAGGEAARSAMAAAGAAYLHPLAKATQVKHILGSAAHAARAAELAAGDDRAVGPGRIERFREMATPLLIDVLRRYPLAPSGGGRVGELIRELDRTLRA